MEFGVELGRVGLGRARLNGVSNGNIWSVVELRGVWCADEMSIGWGLCGVRSGCSVEWNK